MITDQATWTMLRSSELGVVIECENHKEKGWLSPVCL